MKKLYSLYLVLSIGSSFLFAEEGHSAQGTNWTSSGVNAYATFRHGVDGALFLDPYFLPFLKDVKNLMILDAGCGAGPWAITAAKNGARVYGIDIQDEMITFAKKRAVDAGFDTTIQFSVGSVADLQYDSDFFDRAISINVGCNLPPDVFRAHLKELFRTLKSNGKVIITAPASFYTVFAMNKEHIRHEIDRALAEIESIDARNIREKLATLQDVLRATFTVREGRLVLVEDEKELVEGESIWRKIPGLVVPNYYHSEKAYIDELLKAGFSIDQIDRPRFASANEWRGSSADLGREYSYYHPFAIFHVSK